MVQRDSGRSTRLWAARLLAACLSLILLPIGAICQESAASPQQQFSTSQQLLLQGDLDGALAAAREGLKSAPRSIEGLNLLGIILDQQKQYAQAEAAFEQALKIDPRSTKTHNNLGNNYALAHKLDLAEREFRVTLRLRPGDPAANYNLGRALLAKGNSRGAITYLSRVEPRDANTSLILVQAYLDVGEAAKALALAKTLSSETKDDPRLHFSLGVTLASKKQYAPAIHELELADALSPGTFEILHNLGQAYLRNQNDAGAEYALTRALAVKPDSADTMYLLAQAEADERKYLEALDLLLRARKVDPHNVDVLFLMGQISMIQDLFEDAVPVLEDAVKMAPRRAESRAALGESYFALGKVDRALGEFKTLIDLDPSAVSYAFLGLAYRHLGRFDEAKQYLRQGLAKDPHNPECLYNLGLIADKQGNYTEAERLLKAALKSSPDFNEALYALATVRMNEGKYSETIPLLRQCAQAMAHPAEAYYKLATAERNLRQTEAAARDLKVFETLSKTRERDALPFQHLFDALNQRLALPPQEKAEAELQDLEQQVAKHPNNPRYLYFELEALLKTGQLDKARKTAARLDQLSKGDYRTALNVGTLFANYQHYPEAIQHFQTALAANPDSDDPKYDLANAYFELSSYNKALETIQQVSPDGQNDDSYLALFGDILAHLGRASEAAAIFKKASEKNPDNDEYVLLLALTELRAGETAAAEKTLRESLARIPNSARLYWGLGVLSMMKGQSQDAERNLARSRDLMPDWRVTYLALSTLYYETGEISKARETFGSYRKLFPPGALDVEHLEQKLDCASSGGPNNPLSPEARREFLQVILSLADPP